MKQKIKPSPVAVMITGVFFAFSIIFTGKDIVLYNSLPDKEFIGIPIFAAIVFFCFLAAYLLGKKIEFDEENFTVGSKTYKFSEISKVEVKPAEVMRGIATFELEVYVKDKLVCSFTKAEKGSDEFVELMKKHGITVSIDV